MPEPPIVPLPGGVVWQPLPPKQISGVLMMPAVTLMPDDVVREYCPEPVAVKVPLENVGEVAPEVRAVEMFVCQANRSAAACVEIFPW